MPKHGLVGFMGKGRKQRSVALPKQALDAVVSYLEETGESADGSLLRRKDDDTKGIGYLTVRDIVTRWSERVVGTQLTPHKLRRAFRKHCVEHGIDIRVIAAALGHESLESTKLYTQVSLGRTQIIADKFSRGTAISKPVEALRNGATYRGIQLTKFDVNY